MSTRLFLHGEPQGGKWTFVCLGCKKTFLLPRPTVSHICEAPERDLLSNPCKYLGHPTDETFTCKGCSAGSPRQHAVFSCGKHKKCLPLLNTQAFRCCSGCGSYRDETEGPNEASELPVIHVKSTRLLQAKRD